MNRQPNGLMSPQICVLVYDRSAGQHKHEFVVYNNIRELRRDMRAQLVRAVDGEIHVARSRRGEWGEWFEVWDLWAGKPRLLREGWQ